MTELTIEPQLNLDEIKERYPLSYKEMLVKLIEENFNMDLYLFFDYKQIYVSVSFDNEIDENVEAGKPFMYRIHSMDHQQPEVNTPVLYASGDGFKTRPEAALAAFMQAFQNLEEILTHNP